MAGLLGREHTFRAKGIFRRLHGKKERKCSWIVGSELGFLHQTVDLMKTVSHDMQAHPPAQHGTSYAGI